MVTCLMYGVPFTLSAFLSVICLLSAPLPPLLYTVSQRLELCKLFLNLACLSFEVLPTKETGERLVDGQKKENISFLSASGGTAGGTAASECGLQGSSSTLTAPRASATHSSCASTAYLVALHQLLTRTKKPQCLWIYAGRHGDDTYRPKAGNRCCFLFFERVKEP